MVLTLGTNQFLDAGHPRPAKEGEMSTPVGCCTECTTTLVLLRKQEGKRVLIITCPTCRMTNIFNLDEMLKVMDEKSVELELDTEGLSLAPGPTTPQ